MALSIEQHRKLARFKGRTLGEALKRQSDMVVDITWDRDIAARTGYIYDYFSDDCVGTIKNLRPWESKTKVAVDIKFIVTQHGTLNKDQVEYKLQFRPSHRCPLDYYHTDYDLKYGMEYPVGLYIDIPDEDGVYRKWLICSRSLDPQFITYSILPCNYTFRWVHDGTIIVMDGVARLRNSYNSGIWTDYLTTTVENQDQLWLPLNKLATTIFYNQRFLISAPIPTPIAWRVSKIETIHPVGIYKVVVAQDLFDRHRDLVDLNENILIADYYKSNVTPEMMDPPVDIALPLETYTIESSSKFSRIRVGGSPIIFRLAAWDRFDNPISEEALHERFTSYQWAFLINGQDVSDRLTILENEDRSVAVSVSDISLLSHELMIEVTATSQDDCVVTSCAVEVIAL